MGLVCLPIRPLGVNHEESIYDKLKTYFREREQMKKINLIVRKIKEKHVCPVSFQRIALPETNMAHEK